LLKINRLYIHYQHAENRDGVITELCDIAINQTKCVTQF